MKSGPERCVLVSAVDTERIGTVFAAAPAEVVVDLTGAPPEARDDFLRLRVVEAIGAGNDSVASIQINRPGTRWFDEDIIQIVMAVELGIDCFVVPHTECAEHVRAAAELLTEIETEFPVARPIGLEARLQSEAGIEAVDAIASASDRLRALVVDVPSVTAWERAALAASAAGLDLVAGPSWEEAEEIQPPARWVRAEADD
jgi:citrate lyase subunit beta/citryl-CoA lyase